jgi:hypothetical protein
MPDFHYDSAQWRGLSDHDAIYIRAVVAYNPNKTFRILNVGSHDLHLLRRLIILLGVDSVVQAIDERCSDHAADIVAGLESGSVDASEGLRQLSLSHVGGCSIDDRVVGEDEGLVCDSSLVLVAGDSNVAA